MDFISYVDRRRLASTLCSTRFGLYVLQNLAGGFCSHEGTLGRRRGSDLGNLQRLLGSDNALFLDMVVVISMRSSKL